jgi:hypothetical protein
MSEVTRVLGAIAQGDPSAYRHWTYARAFLRAEQGG